MQERKFDVNQLIGFGLMLLLFFGYYFFLTPSAEELEAEKAKQAQTENVASIEPHAQEDIVAAGNTSDSLNQSSTNDNIQEKIYTLQNDKLLLEFTNRGAQLAKVELKEYNAYDDVSENHEKPLYIINDNNANLSLTFNDAQGRTVDLSKRIFDVKQNENSLTFTTQENGGTITYAYTLKGEYDVDFKIKSQGFSKLASDNATRLSFDMNAFSQEKGKSWEQRTTDFHYSLNNYSDEDYTASDFTADSDEKLDWIALKQQFFTTILEKENGMKDVALNVVAPEESDSIHSKYFELTMPIAVSGELNESFTWHFLPLDFPLLKTYDKDFQHIIPFGWGIFGWINEWVILPTFKFMATWGLQYGWVIALLTIVIKLITSPIMYKQYKQSAMMRVLKPDMEELAKKYPNKDDAMKKQQETMALYRTAGVNPLAGCLPALLQIPIFYALFNFFPNIIDLRGKSFLWAEDLTAYDSILDLGFNIPFYGDHISLFALLYVITMVIYFRTSGTMMQTPTQEGMPDMRIIMYLMPIMFIFFLNSYASGLSWYYFVSNALNIGLVFVIKNWLIDDDKIHQKIQANKAKPNKKKKKSKWAQRLDNAMKQAQQQQEQSKKKKK